MWFGAMAAYGGGKVAGNRALPGTGMTATGTAPGISRSSKAVPPTTAVGAMTVEPRASLAYIHAGQGSFTETGARLRPISPMPRPART